MGGAAYSKLPADALKAIVTPDELNVTRGLAHLLKFFVTCCLCAALVPPVVLVGVAGLLVMFWVDKAFLVYHCKMPAVMGGAKQSTAAVKLLIMYMSLVLPWSAYLFYLAALNQTGRNTTFALVVSGFVLIVIITFGPDCMHQLIFDKIPVDHCLRNLLGLKLETLAGSGTETTTLTYFQAQWSWPKENKYHMSQFYYAGLPADVNPENLSEETAAKSATEGVAAVIQEHAQQIIQATVVSTQQQPVVYCYMPQQPMAYAQAQAQPQGVMMVGQPHAAVQMAQPQAQMVYDPSSGQYVNAMPAQMAQVVGVQPAQPSAAVPNVAPGMMYDPASGGYVQMQAQQGRTSFVLAPAAPQMMYDPASGQYVPLRNNM